MDDKILLIRTGGTIDAVPYDDPRNPPTHVETLKGNDSIIPAFLEKLGLEDRVELYNLTQSQEDRFSKDSQLYGDDDYAALADIIRAAPQRHIVITHGTDAMLDNAAKLSRVLGKMDKTIIFTGAMVPLSMESAQLTSNGIDSLRYAITTVPYQQRGVYVAAHNMAGSQTLFSADTPATKVRDVSKERLEYTVGMHDRLIA